MDILKIKYLLFFLTVITKNIFSSIFIFPLEMLVTQPWYPFYFFTSPLTGQRQDYYIRTFNVMSLKDWLAAVLYALLVVIELGAKWVSGTLGK